MISYTGSIISIFATFSLLYIGYKARKPNLYDLIYITFTPFKLLTGYHYLEPKENFDRLQNNNRE